MISVLKRYWARKDRKRGAGILGLVFAASILGTSATLNSAQPIPIPDNTAIFASESIIFDKDVNILSGDVLSNGVISADQNSLFQGSIIADIVNLSQNAHIFGNVEADTINQDKNVTIDGETTSPRETADFIMLEITPFTPGTQNITLNGDNAILSPSSYDKVIINSNSKVTVSGGTYNLATFTVDANAILNFSQPVTFNIANKFTIEKNVIFNLDSNLDINDIHFNYSGSQLVSIGHKGFLAGKILAPNTQVFIGQQNIWRGQILAKDIILAQKNIISREVAFDKPIDLTKIITDEQGLKFTSNEIIVLFVSDSTVEDAEKIAASISAKVTGYINIPPIYKFEISATTAQQLKIVIDNLQNTNNPKISIVSYNLIGSR